MDKPKFHWSGQIEETIDGLAYIGPNPSDAPNVFVATGDSGMGMTHGTIAGLLLTDLIFKRENPWAKLYDASRKTPGALKEWLKENINSVIQYRDYVTPGEVSSIKEIRRGEGAIYREGLEKRAIYRDSSGTVHTLSAVCPHLGGMVRWNTAEKSWDCPCHGSRFSAEGKVIQGPAISNLCETQEKIIETEEGSVTVPSRKTG